MPDVKVKGYSGAEFGFENVPKVWLAAPGSTDDNPVLVPFTYGEALEGVEVVPDFSEGDQTITLPDGYLAKSAVVKQPEALTPENIRKGTSVAGVEGSYEGDLPDMQSLTVELDFSEGDMEISPSEDTVFKKVSIPKPANLLPANIASGVDVAGVVGTFEGGGGVQLEGDFLKYVVYQLDDENKEIVVYGILWTQLYADTGSYDISIPSSFGAYQVVIASEGIV